MSRSLITVGSRSSKLALTQCDLLAASLKELEVEVKIERFSTLGDKKRDLGPNVARDKHDWIFEIQNSLLSSEIDLALHSAKDVPLTIDPKTELIPILSRATPNDIFVYSESLGRINSIGDLPQGARIGTSSKRRAAQLLRQREDLEIVEIRGNVPTRLAKLSAEAELDGIVLAAAGIQRLALSCENSFLLPLDKMIPAVNQGILLAQIRKSDAYLSELLKKISPVATARACQAERAIIEALEADCTSAVGVYASITSEDKLCIVAEVCSNDGSCCYESSVEAEADDEVGVSKVIAELLRQGAKELLQSNT